MRGNVWVYGILGKYVLTLLWSGWEPGSQNDISLLMNNIGLIGQVIEGV